jgi:hypothetical protein
MGIKYVVYIGPQKYSLNMGTLSEFHCNTISDAPDLYLLEFVFS